MTFFSEISTQVSFLFQSTSDWLASTPSKTEGFRIQSYSSGFTTLDRVLPYSGWSQQMVHEILIPDVVTEEYGVIAPFLRQQAHKNHTILLYQPPSPTVIQSFIQYGIPESNIRIIHSAQQSVEWFLQETLRTHPEAVLVAWVADGRTDIMKALIQASHKQSNVIFALSNMHNLTNNYKDVVRIYTEPRSYSTPGEKGFIVRCVSGKGRPLSDNIFLDLTPPVPVTIPFSLIRSPRKNAPVPLRYAKPARLTNTAHVLASESDSTSTTAHRTALSSKK